MTEEPLTPNTDDIGARARTAVGWRALSQFSSQGIQIVTSIILARLLMPSDFGIIGMAGIVTGLAGVFQDLGFGQALVQRAELRPEHSRSAFWMTLIMGTLLYTALYFGAPWAGEYFHDERMVPVLRLMALSFLISPFGVVPRSLLQRELDFRKPFYAGLAGTIANGGVGITMALLGYGYWSLVWALLASSVVGTIALCIVTRYAPPVVPSLRGARELFAFGSVLTLSSLLNFASNRVDYLVVARRLSAEALGIYSRAFTLMEFVPSFVAGVSSAVLFPSFAQLQGNHDRVRSAFISSISVMGVCGWPLLVVLAILSPDLIPGVLGPHWVGAIVPAQVLSSLGCLYVVGAVIASYLKGSGHVHWLTLLQAVRGGLAFSGVWVGASYGMVGATIGVLVGLTLSFLVDAAIADSFLRLGYRGWWVALRSPLVVAAVMGSVCATVAPLLKGLGATPVFAAAAAACAGLCGCVGLLRLSPFPEMRLVRDLLAHLLPPSLISVLVVSDHRRP